MCDRLTEELATLLICIYAYMHTTYVIWRSEPGTSSHLQRECRNYSLQSIVYSLQSIVYSLQSRGDATIFDDQVADRALVASRLYVELL
jgi:hypothetical protein